jgi:hypothetical protein
MRHIVSEFGELFLWLLLLISIFLLITWGTVAMAEKSCYAQTESIGFPSRWSFWGACQIEVTPGQWIPLNNYYFKQE